MTVTNKGPDTATNVQLADPAPAGITYLSVVPGSPTCTVTPALLTCSLGTLEVGSVADDHPHRQGDDRSDSTRTRRR